MNQNYLDLIKEKAVKTDVGKIPVRQFMTRDYVTITTDYSIRSAIEVLAVNKMSGVCIADKNGKLIGLISEFDLLLQVASKHPLDHIEVPEKPIISLTEEMSLKETIILFFSKKLKMAPVIDKKKKIVGQVFRIQLLKTILEGQ